MSEQLNAIENSSEHSTAVAGEGEFTIGGPGRLGPLPPDATDEQRRDWEILQTMDRSVTGPDGDE